MKPFAAVCLSLVALAALAAPSAPAEACAFCTCAQPDYPDPAQAVTEALESAEAVFLGEVVEIRTPGGKPCDRAQGCTDEAAGPVVSTRSFQAGITIAFSVEEAWKGLDEGAATMTLTTNNSGEACGFPFEVGRAYLVYGQDYAATLEGIAEQQGSGLLSTNICTRTQPAEDAGFDLKVLGR